MHLTYHTPPVDNAGDRQALEDIEITPSMIAAGEGEILREVGGADLGGYFSARDLAISVYRAMGALSPKVPHR